ncbi:MAG: FliH/SctL family protein [Bacteriovoracaceae bacterium]
MDKYKNSEIKPFVFSDLQSNHVVTQAKPEGYEFQNLSVENFQYDKPLEETIRTERKFEQKKSFKIDKVVRDHRGISEQESDDLEKRVAAEVQRRIDKVYQAAFEQGLSEGRQEGINQIKSESSNQVDATSNEILQLLEQFKEQVEKNTHQHKNEMIDFVKQFAKWVLVKEIDEKEYLSSLLEKLLHELNARRNMIIRVNEQSYSVMPEVISQLEKKLGAFSNVRLEVSRDMNLPGIMLESENGIVDASLENIFTKLDRFFEQAGKGE